MQSQYLSDLQNLLNCRSNIQLAVGKYFNSEDDNNKVILAILLKLAKSERRGALFSLLTQNPTVISSSKEHVSWIQELASQGSMEAQFILGLLLWYGEGVCQLDHECSLYWITKAAEQEPLDPVCEVDKNISIAAKEFLFNIYGEDDGLFEDKEKAIYWLSKAAKLGMPKFQLKLGQYYAEINNPLHDSDRAIYWMSEAAKSSYLEAQFELGNCYADGLTSMDSLVLSRDYYKYMPQDKEKAEYWLTLAANNPKQIALTDLAGGGLYDVNTIFFPLYLKIPYSLGVRYADGIGLNKNSEKAEYWLIKAAELGEDESNHGRHIWEEIGIRYGEGRGIPKNIEQAEYWLIKAADSGSEESIKKLNSFGFKYKKILAKLGLFKTKRNINAS